MFASLRSANTRSGRAQMAKAIWARPILVRTSLVLAPPPSEEVLVLGTYVLVGLRRAQKATPFGRGRTTLVRVRTRSSLVPRTGV